MGLLITPVVLILAVLYVAWPLFSDSGSSE
jgi:hypothetical protein